jgi:hypothetical protein
MTWSQMLGQLGPPIATLVLVLVLAELCCQLYEYVWEYIR